MWRSNVVIEEVDCEFMQYSLECKEKQKGFILLLEEQEKTVDYVLNEYGNMNAFEINELPVIQNLISYSFLVKNKRVIPADFMLGIYL